MTLFSGFVLKNIANNKGTNTTERLNKNPALEIDVNFNPIVTTEINKNNMDPNINPYINVLKSIRIKRL